MPPATGVERRGARTEPGVHGNLRAGWGVWHPRAPRTHRGGTFVAQTALAELYARQAPAARRLAYLLTSDTRLAEDIVQD